MTTNTAIFNANVINVYKHIATHFDKTRFALWPGVTGFLDSLATHAKVLDVGCGNGKYLSYRPDIDMVGCDTCSELVDIASNKSGSNVIVVDGHTLPWGEATFDAVICVAVLHHLSTCEHRLQFMGEIVRVMKPGGQSFITVWHHHGKKHTSADMTGKHVFIPWTHATGGIYQRYYYMFGESELVELVSECGGRVTHVNHERGNLHVKFTKLKQLSALS